MMNKLKYFLVNSFVSFLSLVLLFLCLEFFVFRFVLIAADQPKIDFVDGVVKYQPNQQGIYRVRDEIKAEYHINSDGWNSKYEDYNLKKENGKYRIAIIGDSYVEALQVNYNESLAEQLERKLGSDRARVYRFGISGAPLSQYLHMVRKEVISYAPDLIVLVVVHNDFSESYQFKPGVYTSSFLKIKIEGNAVTGETPPQVYKPQWYNLFRETATWRYLTYRQQVQFQTLRNIILRPEGDKKPQYQANIDVSTLDRQFLKDKIVTEYIFEQLKDTAKENGAELLIVMDGDRNSISKQVDSAQLYQTGSLRLNAMAQSVAQKYNIHYIDLHPIFEKDFSIRQHPLRFQHDGHWNIYTHELVADVILDYIERHFID